MFTKQAVGVGWCTVLQGIVLHSSVVLMLRIILLVVMMITMVTTEAILRVVCVVKRPSVRWTESGSSSGWWVRWRGSCSPSGEPAEGPVAGQGKTFECDPCGTRLFVLATRHFSPNRSFFSCNKTVYNCDYYDYPCGCCRVHPPSHSTCSEALKVVSVIHTRAKKQTARFNGNLEIGPKLKIPCKMFTKVGASW